jgi:ABC-type xylose transport system permease subunit
MVYIHNLAALLELPLMIQSSIGMGNRFRDMEGYYPLILAHGVIATIVFLGLVPASVMIVRYYSIYDRYQAYRYHVWLQVMTLFLTTVVFVLGWFAVGPARSLTNPHHGIGLALYVMVIFQVLWGWLSHKIQLGRRTFRTPLTLVVYIPLFACSLHQLC